MTRPCPAKDIEIRVEQDGSIRIMPIPLCDPAKLGEWFSEAFNRALPPRSLYDVAGLVACGSCGKMVDGETRITQCLECFDKDPDCCPQCGGEHLLEIGGFNHRIPCPATKLAVNCSHEWSVPTPTVGGLSYPLYCQKCGVEKESHV